MVPWIEVPTLDRGVRVTYLGQRVPTLNGEGVPTLDGGTYLGWGYLPWMGVPTLDRGYLPWMGGTPSSLTWKGTPVSLNGSAPLSGWMGVPPPMRLDEVPPVRLNGGTPPPGGGADRAAQ